MVQSQFVPTFHAFGTDDWGQSGNIYVLVSVWFQQWDSRKGKRKLEMSVLIWLTLRIVNPTVSFSAPFSLFIRWSSCSREMINSQSFSTVIRYFWEKGANMHNNYFLHVISEMSWKILWKKNLRVVEKSGHVVGTASTEHWSLPFTNTHPLLPGLSETEYWCVYQVTNVHMGEIRQKIIIAHPANKDRNSSWGARGKMANRRYREVNFTRILHHHHRSIQVLFSHFRWFFSTQQIWEKQKMIIIIKEKILSKLISYVMYPEHIN